ncbi:hypothetical protein OIDMADRAFT_47838 [Oidiodendron maius Zn]|uniref:Uncharacterized protein n=1 Tax=Oidiodendron maius (strain Zn) TaxID=913774 RepID=A0A0C3HYM0_OIDMZ|nr:hypothetical protein OIDMADRAFT_47838 [Oidiodendron maius Zn]
MATEKRSARFNCFRCNRIRASRLFVPESQVSPIVDSGQDRDAFTDGRVQVSKSARSDTLRSPILPTWFITEASRDFRASRLDCPQATVWKQPMTIGFWRGGRSDTGPAWGDVQIRTQVHQRGGQCTNPAPPYWGTYLAKSSVPVGYAGTAAHHGSFAPTLFATALPWSRTAVFE